MDKENLTIEVELAYLESSTKHYLEKLNVPVHSTVQDVILASLLFSKYPDFNIKSIANRVEIFGKQVSIEKVVVGGDRIEVYRPLLIDPKQARRNRAGTYKKRIRPKKKKS